MKIVYITPHLSTGGMPEYLRKKVELLHKDNEIWVFELVYERQYTSIREKIASMIGSNLISLDQNYKKLFDLLQKISPDIIHFEETSDHFLPHSLLDKIYSPIRTWKIFETLHDSSIDHREKKYLPDKMLVVSLWQVKNFLPLGIPIEIIEHEITPGERNRELGMKTLGLDPEKKHVLQVGLFSNRKNQRFTFSLARLMPDVQFHFVGALPDNYRDHWRDLVDNKPPNCVIWKERSDVHNFYSCVDAVIFPSEGKYGDTETNPLAIKEAIAWDIPLFLRNIPVYMNGYQESSKLKWMTQDLKENSKILYSMLNLINNYTLIKPDFFNQKLFDIQFDKSDNKLTINYLHDIPFDMMVCIRDLDTEIPIYSFDARFENKNNYWAIPLPKSYYDFSENPNFSGFLVDFYDPGGNLLYSQSFGIKLVDTQKKKFRIDTYEPVFVNFEQFFTDKIYDKFFSQIEDLDLVLDIGSSVGLFTELAKDKGAKKIVAFEVSDRATKIFNNLHGKDSRVELIKMAVWDKRETIKIYEDQNNSIISSAITKTDKYFETPSIDLDSFFHENRIEKVSLMKMDIEGSEYKAFDGLSDENLLKIENIILEFHDNVNNKLSNITSRFEIFGYEIQFFTEDCITKSNPYIDQKGVVFLKKIAHFDRSQKIDTRKNTTKPIIIISCHITDTRSSQILKSSIKNLRKIGFDLALIGNSIVDKEILEQIDHYFYSKETPLFSEIYTGLTLVNFILYRQSEGVIYNDFTESHQRHGLPILINLFNCLNFLKSKGYQHFYRIEGDSILSENAIPFFVEMWQQCIKYDKKGFVFENTLEKNISTHLLFSDINFFLENVKQIYTESDYIDYLQKKSGNLDFMTVEEYLFDNLKKQDCLIRYDGNQFEKNFSNSDWNLLVSSHSLPLKYRGCTTRLSKNKKDGATVIFSLNYTNEKIIRQINIYFTDKIEKIEHHMTSGNLSDWCWDLYTEKIEKIEVFQNGEFLYEEKYEDMINIIELL